MDGQSCNKHDGCRSHVAQLRRLVLVLMVWASLITSVLVISMSLHFIYPRASNTTEKGGTSVQAISATPFLAKSSILTLYELDQDDKTAELKWKRRFQSGLHHRSNITVEYDRSYFLYLQVTLEGTNKGVNYSIEVEKILDSNKREKILEGHINTSQKSTGLMGKGLLLSAGTNVRVTCKPPTNLSSKDTYLGMIKL